MTMLDNAFPFVSTSNVHVDLKGSDRNVNMCNDRPDHYKIHQDTTSATLSFPSLGCNFCLFGLF